MSNLEHSESENDFGSPHTTFVSKGDVESDSIADSDFSHRTMPTWSCIELDDGIDADELDSGYFKSRFQTENAFIMKQLVGSGGVGEVWSAIQVSLGRIVAVKRIRPDILEKSKNSKKFINHMFQRFHDEALITARLDHPNILPVYDLGQDMHGHPLLAMKLVHGEPWSRSIAKDMHHNIPDVEYYSKHLPIFLEMMQAVAFAHSRGIVHRDLKPSQVMLGEYGEILLIDWGLAMFIGDQQTPESSDDLDLSIFADLPSAARITNPSGTPALMAPEQTIKSTRSISPLTDIYLLGGTLYYLLTGEYPHDAETKIESMKRASRGEVEKPDLRTKKRTVPDDLADIAMRALQPKPKDRYQSVNDMIEAVKLHLSGESQRRESLRFIQQAEDHYLEMSEKYVMLDENGLLQKRRELCNIDQVYDSLNKAETAINKSLALWPEHEKIAPLKNKITAASATIAINTGDLQLARRSTSHLTDLKLKKLINTQIEDEYQKKKRQSQIRTVSLTSVAILSVILIITFVQSSISQSRSNQLLQHERNLAVVSSENAEIQKQLALRARAEALREKYFANITYAQSELNAGSIESAKNLIYQRIDDHDNLNWEWGHLVAKTSDARMTVIRSIETDSILHVSYCNDGNYIIVGDRSGGLSVYNSTTGKLFRKEQVADDGVWYVRTTKDNSKIILISFDHTVKIVDFSTLEILKTFEGHENILRGLALSNDERMIITGCKEGGGIAFDFENGEKLYEFQNPHNVLYAMDYNPVKEEFLAAGWRFVHKYDAQTGEVLKKSLEHPENILSVNYSPDGKTFVTACTDRNARVFDSETFEHLLTIPNETSWLHVAKYSHDGKMIATGDNNGTCRVWNAQTGDLLYEFKTAPRIYKLDFSADDQSIVTAANDLVEIFDLKYGPDVNSGYIVIDKEQLEEQTNENIDLASFDIEKATFDRVFSAPMERAGAWNLFDEFYQYPNNATHSTVFYHDENAFNIQSYYIDVNYKLKKLVRVDYNSLEVTIEEYGKNVFIDRLDFSQFYVLARWIPNSEFFLTVTNEGRVQRWKWDDLDNPVDIGTFDKMPDGHAPKIPGVLAFSEDGARFAVGRYDGAVEVYNSRKLNLESQYQTKNNEPVISLAFSHNKELLAVGKLSGDVELINLKQLRRYANLSGHLNFVIDLDFSQDDKRLLTTGHDDQVILWDTGSGRKIMRVFELPDEKFILASGFCENEDAIFSVTSDEKLLYAEAMPWKSEELPGDPELMSVQDRIELYKREEYVKKDLSMDVISEPLVLDQTE